MLTDVCENAGFLLRITVKVVKILQIAIPIILIILICFDLFKAFTSQLDEKSKNEAISKAAKRFLYAVIVFLIPTIITFIFTSINSLIKKDDSLSSSVSWLDCWLSEYTGVKTRTHGGTSFTPRPTSEPTPTASPPPTPTPTATPYVCPTPNAKQACTPGYYYNSRSNKCESCPSGFYYTIDYCVTDSVISEEMLTNQSGEFYNKYKQLYTGNNYFGIIQYTYATSIGQCAIEVEKGYGYQFAGTSTEISSKPYYCYVGSYSSETRYVKFGISSGCTPCPNGKTTKHVGSTSINDCI